MASVLLDRLKQQHRAAQRRLIIVQSREPALYTTHRHQFQADLARRDIDPLWFGQALYIQFLGSQIVAVEYALCDDGEATAQRFAAACGRQAWQIVALAKRLCVLAQAPSVGVYVQSGRLPMSWSQLLKDLGLASITRSQHAARGAGAPAYTGCAGWAGWAMYQWANSMCVCAATTDRAACPAQRRPPAPPHAARPRAQAAASTTTAP